MALIATDGKPARAYRVGATVDGDHVLLAVSQRARRSAARRSAGGGAGTAAVSVAATGRPGAVLLRPACPRCRRGRSRATRRSPGDEGADPVQSAESSEDRPPQALPAPPIGPATR
ncbi:MAG: hypothetical protein KIS83_07020 [Rubrivivax sp.]|nr:hypothetical protein [Rubrivivax sp.]